MVGGGVGVAERQSVARSFRFAPYVAVVSAAILYALRIDAFGLSGDEGFTAKMISLSWSDMLSDLGKIDYNMSAHYVTLKVWSSALGTSEIALRSMSVVAVLVAAVLLYRWLDTRFGRIIGLVALVMLLFNPYVVAMATTARPYAMLILWSVGATWLLDRAVASTASTLSWLAYAVVAVIGIHIHLLAVLVIGAHAIYALGVARRLMWVHAEAAAVIIAFGLVPTLLFIAPSDTLAWIPPVSLRGMVEVGIDVAGGPAFALFAVPLGIVGLVKPPNGGPRWLPAVWLLVPLAAIVAMIPIQSLFIADYFSPIVAAATVVVAFGIVRLVPARPGIALAVAAGICLVAVATSWSSLGGSEGSTWRELSDEMVGRVEIGDGIAYPNAFYRIVGEYYSPDGSSNPFPPGEPALPVAAWGTATPYQLDLLKRIGFYEPHAMFEPPLLEWRRLWVVGTDGSYTQAILADLTAHGYEEVDGVVTGGMNAHLMVRDGSAVTHDGEALDESG